jgi:signal peptide peptidase SppA
MKKLNPISIAAAAFVGTLWFGTDESYLQYMETMAQVQQLEAAGPDALKAAIQMRGGGRGDDPFGLPPLWTAEGETAVVSIKGNLVNGSSGFYRFFGILGYEDIKAAVGEALEDRNIKRIILDIDSPGGAVNGLDEVGSFIRKAAAIKPVVSYTSGSMASAAYWLGISATRVYSSRMAQVGSVGTLIVHMEVTKALEEQGRKATLFRYGHSKALGHPFEKLSEKAAEQIQGMADDSGKIFVQYAADRRGTTPEEFQKTMGEGRVFMGKAALDVGLVDGIMSFEELMASKTLDKARATAENPRHSAQAAQGTNMKIRAISQAVILALAAGTKVEALGLAEPVANVEGTKPEADDVSALTAQATEVQAAIDARIKTATEAAAAAATAASDKVVAAKDSELSALTAKVTLLEAGAADLTSKVTAANTVAATYAGVVKKSITVMATALGVADTGATLTGEALSAEHARLEEAFTKKFPTGGVAAVAKPVEQTAAEASPSPEFLAAVGGWKR